MNNKNKKINIENIGYYKDNKVELLILYDGNRIYNKKLEDKKWLLYRNNK